MPTIAAADLRTLMRELLLGVGTPADIATMVGNSLVDANLAGHDSHGVIRILHYLEMCEAGQVSPTAEPELIREHGATAIIDGKWGWGQRSMWLATETACDRARQFGLGAAVVVGGRELTPALRAKIPYAAYCDQLRHLVAFVAVLSCRIV